MKNLLKKFISLFLALSFAFQLAVTGYAETQGGNTLVTNTYQDKNGLLTKSAYGNGHNILYLYDELGRVYSEKHGSDPIIRYYYDNNGNLARLTGGQGDIAGVKTPGDGVLKSLKRSSIERTIAIRKEIAYQGGMVVFGPYLMKKCLTEIKEGLMH